MADGHHRVSVARALGWNDINAIVTEVITRVGADHRISLADLPLMSHERIFFERVPLPEEAREQIRLRDPMAYAQLAEGVEAWGFRAIQDHGEPMDRLETARLWLECEYVPVVSVLREHGLVGKRTETEAYMVVSAERYRLLRTHEWTDEAWRVVTGD